MANQLIGIKRSDFVLNDELVVALVSQFDRCAGQAPHKATGPDRCRACRRHQALGSQYTACGLRRHKLVAIRRGDCGQPKVIWEVRGPANGFSIGRQPLGAGFSPTGRHSEAILARTHHLNQIAFFWGTWQGESG